MVLGLIETVEAVMSHISSNLQPREAHVTIVGSSSMAGSLAAWARAVTGSVVGGTRVGVWPVPPRC